MAVTEFLEVAKWMRTSGRTKHIEHYRLIANLGSKVYALNDRCNHRMVHFQWDTSKVRS